MSTNPHSSVAGATEADASRWHRFTPYGGLLVVLLVVAAVYAPTLNDPFAGDDYLVLGPVRARGPWELIWTSLLMRDGIPYWRPLVSPLYALEVHGFGLRAWAFHAVAVSLHLTNVTLLYMVARRLVASVSVALLAALLFGVTPAHSTTVAQVSSTVELLSVVFYLLTVWCAVTFVQTSPPESHTPNGALLAPAPPTLAVRGRPHGELTSAAHTGLTAPTNPRSRSRSGPVQYPGGAQRIYALSLLAFGLALLTKESTASAAAVVAAVFWLLDPRPDGRIRRALLRSLPFLLLVPPYALLTYITDTSDPTGIARQLYKPGMHIGQNLWWMAARLAVPVGDGIGPRVSIAGHIGAAVVVAAGLMVAWRGSAAARLLAAWTVIAMTPLVPWQPAMMLGRFTYQAALPFAVLLAMAVGWAAQRTTSPFRLWLYAAGAAAVLTGSALTVSQNRARTREALAYGALVTQIRHAGPYPDGARIVVRGEPFSGPFHALYLTAVTDTLYGVGTVPIRWEPGPSGAESRVTVER